LTTPSPHLDIVLIAPLCGVVGFHPCIIAVHQGYVVANVAAREVLVGIVSKDLQAGCVTNRGNGGDAQLEDGD
jgi:hypothetical protein